MMFFLIKNYPQVLISISMLMILCAASRLIWSRSLSLIKDFRAIYRTLKIRKWLRLLIILVFFLNCVALPLKAQQNISADISLNYVKASQGLNPNGTRYNPAGILSTEILENAVEKGALHDITAKDLGRVLSVVPKVQGNSYDEGQYFISTQFVLSYNANQDTASLDGELLLNLAAESYKEWFVSKYSDNVGALDMNFTEFEREDYLDICEYLKKRADLIRAYMTGMASEEPAFQSASNGETFQSVASQADNVSAVMVEKLEAYLLENGVSKSTDAYMSRLGFQNVFSYFDGERADSSYKNSLAAISMYEDDMARIVLVPTVDTEYQFYMSQTRIGIDDFAKRAESYSNNRTKINDGIVRNNHILNQLSTFSHSNGTDERAETLVMQIEAELNKLADKAQTMIKEYSASQSNKYITITVSSVEERAIRIIIDIVFYTVLFAFAVYCAAFTVVMGISFKRAKHVKNRAAAGE